MERDGEEKFDEIHLIEEKLPFCIGCSNCFRIGHEKCPHYNVMRKIIKKWRAPMELFLLRLHITCGKQHC